MPSPVDAVFDHAAEGRAPKRWRSYRGELLTRLKAEPLSPLRWASAGEALRQAEASPKHLAPLLFDPAVPPLNRAVVAASLYARRQAPPLPDADAQLAFLTAAFGGLLITERPRDAREVLQLSLRAGLPLAPFDLWRRLALHEPAPLYRALDLSPSQRAEADAVLADPWRDPHTGRPCLSLERAWVGLPTLEGEVSLVLWFRHAEGAAGAVFHWRDEDGEHQERVPFLSAGAVGAAADEQLLPLGEPWPDPLGALRAMSPELLPLAPDAPPAAPVGDGPALSTRQALEEVEALWGLDEGLATERMRPENLADLLDTPRWHLRLTEGSRLMAALLAGHRPEAARTWSALYQELAEAPSSRGTALAEEMIRLADPVYRYRLGQPAVRAAVRAALPPDLSDADAIIGATCAGELATVAFPTRPEALGVALDLSRATRGLPPSGEGSPDEALAEALAEAMTSLCGACSLRCHHREIAPEIAAAAEALGHPARWRPA
ncbi:MAG: hypothetical protein JXX28_08230 [Deltaproteobacteria bacterium]|nr:hypothetical protein [Deltaproteobacteria bacterium]